MEEAIAGKNKGMIKDREVRSSSTKGRAVQPVLSVRLRPPARHPCVLAVTALGGSGHTAGNKQKECAADPQRVVCFIVSLVLSQISVKEAIPEGGCGSLG